MVEKNLINLIPNESSENEKRSKENSANQTKKRNQKNG